MREANALERPRPMGQGDLTVTDTEPRLARPVHSAIHLKAVDRFILLGQRGSGKSTVGRELDTIIKGGFTDLDDVVTKRLGMSIQDFIKEYGADGWFRFREIEKKALEDVLAGNSAVIALGGGTTSFGKVSSTNGVTISDEGASKLLKETIGTRVFLQGSPEELTTRILADQRNKRPTLIPDTPSVLEETRRIYQERFGAYLSQANICVEVDGKTPAQIVQKILDLDKEYKKAA